MATETVQQLEDTLREQRRVHDREIQRETSFIREEIDRLKKIKPPSEFWYILLLQGALVADIIDFIEGFCLLTTGAACFAVSIWYAIAVALFFTIVGYFYGNKIKRVEKHSAKIASAIGKIDIRIGQYRQLAAATFREGRKLGVLRKPLRTLARKFGSISKFTRKPFRQLIIKNILQLIPVVDLWFWQTSAIRQLHKDRIAAYEEAQRLIAEYQEALRTEELAFQEFQQQEYDVGIQALQEPEGSKAS